MADLHATPGKEPIIRVEGGLPRILSHDGATELVSYLEYTGRLTYLQQQFLCGALLHKRYIDQPIAAHEHAELNAATAVPVGVVPDTPIIKMMKGVHADALLTRGTIRLGSIDYYRKYDDIEIGDPTEGVCVLSAFDGVKTAIAEVRGGLNDLLFCAYQGEVDYELVNRMGYDSAVEIIDVEGFASAIAKSLSSTSSRFSPCVYVRDRALYGDATALIDRQSFMDGPIAEMLGDARAFLKPLAYAHQREFRFSWTAPNRQADYLDIECHDIIPLCRKL